MDIKKYLRKYQKKALIEQHKYKKCLINMWCGTGKTRVFTISLIIYKRNLNVIVFPSLALINQYCKDYILSREEPFKSIFKKYKCLAFCSDDNYKGIEFTTTPDNLINFINSKGKKLILTTYHSYENFIDICYSQQKNIDFLIYDEAHHIVGDSVQNVVFNNNKIDEITDKICFYTATPVNKNGITMYGDEDSDCGPKAYEYLYYQAVKDKICKDFDTQITLYTILDKYQNKYQPVFESIIRACLSGKYDYWNVLSYHSYVNINENDRSYVNDFSSNGNKLMVIDLLKKITAEEFPHLIDKYTIILNGVHSKTEDRKEIIDTFDMKLPGRIYILASCGILNEGIDTKWANMAVPINPSKSVVKESQRIGRLVRTPEKNMNNAIMLIPCMVDTNKYNNVDDDKSRDAMIREELQESGDFNTALNVISAFRYQYDEELYEMCLKYPNKYAPSEVKNNLKINGYKVEESKGNMMDNLKYLKPDINEDMSNCSVDIHTQEGVKEYGNREDENKLKLMYIEDEDKYYPIKEKEKSEKKDKPIEKRKKIFTIKTHPDLDVLWKITENSIDLSKNFCQGVLEVNVDWNEKKWFEKMLLLKEFFDENDSRPSQRSEDIDEKTLGIWLSRQIGYYNKKLLKSKKLEEWTSLINDEKYTKHFICGDEIWYSKLDELQKFLDENENRPNTRSKDILEKALGKWSSTQLTNYKTKKQIMSDEKIHNDWGEFLSNNKKYFIGAEEIWYSKLDELQKFLDENENRPNKNSKDILEKALGQWLSNQLTNYKTKKKIMKDEKIHNDWGEFVLKNKKYLMDAEETWYSKLDELQKFLDENENRPNKNSKDIVEKILGSWLSHQITYYKTKKHIMSDEKIHNDWGEFLSKNKKYFSTQIKSMEYKEPSTIINKTGIKQNQSELSLLHKEYKTYKSENLHKIFKDNPTLWYKYHFISKANEQSFPENEIPRNIVIDYLKHLKGRKKKIIADLGCGYGEISDYFKGVKRFEFHNFDHFSSSENIISRDIKDTELEDHSVDIAILCLSMWGSNCKDYLKEVYRILDTGGTLIIIEPTKRWIEDNKLIKIVEEYNFNIINILQKKFTFIESRK